MGLFAEMRKCEMETGAWDTLLHSKKLVLSAAAGHAWQTVTWL